MKNIMESIFKEKRYAYYLIAVVVIALYAKAVFFDFTYLDDNILVLVNRYFLKDLGNIIKAFRFDAFGREFGYYYRPMLTISLMLDAQISGVSPVIYHVTNILIHLAASCLVFRFFVKSGYPQDKSLLISLIFAVHPVLTQAVVWIPGRNDSLLTVFSLLSFIFLIFICCSIVSPCFNLTLISVLSTLNCLFVVTSTTPPPPPPPLIMVVVPPAVTGVSSAENTEKCVTLNINSPLE